MPSIKPMFTAQEIQRRLKELAALIAKQEGRHLYAIVVLKGSLVFFADLARELHAQQVVVEYDTLEIASYEGAKSSGKVNLVKDVHKLQYPDVLLIEDVADTGLSLQYLMDHLRKHGAKTVKSIVLFCKERSKVKPDYVGFHIPNVYIVGYGIDYNQRYRELPYVGVLAEEKE